MQARYNQWRKYTLHTSDYHVELPDTVTLELTDEEKEIFDFLLLVCKKYNLETTMRVAGGWVRNKLLGIPCADIDIVIDNMSGLQFATYIMKYRDEMDVQNIKQAGVIPARPEQAKHLEVATMHIFKQDIDFANLRNETPDEMGTPMSDAYLRESTINSLFYNINENKIEDFTGGINDLKEGRIKAPQEARPSFFYDPNRIVRLARFASHFNMLIDHDLFEAAKEKDVQEVLYNKISKERFGAEISKLLKGPDPSGGLAILNELTVLHLIFRAKSGVKPFEETPIQWEEIAWDNALNGIKIIYEHIKNESNRERMSVMFAILFLYADNFDVEKGCTEVITNYLKISQQLGVETALLMKSVREVRDWLNVDDYTRFITENRVKVS
jgi:tRNA nucleotidyltransferase/poly(A) polymerase